MLPSSEFIMVLRFPGLGLQTFIAQGLDSVPGKSRIPQFTWHDHKQTNNTKKNIQIKPSKQIIKKREVVRIVIEILLFEMQTCLFYYDSIQFLFRPSLFHIAQIFPVTLRVNSSQLGVHQSLWCLSLQGRVYAQSLVYNLCCVYFHCFAERDVHFIKSPLPHA